MKKETVPWALLINDIHIDKNNIPQFQVNWDEALDVCREYQVPQIIVGGDLWTNRSSQTLSVLMAVRSAILQAEALHIPLIFAEGNHDKVDQEAYLGYSHIFSGYINVSVVDDFTVQCMGDNLYLAIMSYFPENGSFQKKLNKLAQAYDPKETILYIHQGINGAINNCTSDELPASLFADFKLVLAGHYHNRAKVGNNIFYIGSSRQHNFGEDDKKGYTILYKDGTVEFVQNQANQRYYTVMLDADTIEDGKKAISQIAQDGDKVRAQFVCDSNKIDPSIRQTLIDAGACKVEVSSKTAIVEVETQALEVKYDKSTIKKEYTDFCEKKQIEDVEIGLQYLDKIN